jgi:hypothetical protein
MRPVQTATRPAASPRLSIVPSLRATDHPLDAAEAA